MNDACKDPYINSIQLPETIKIEKLRSIVDRVFERSVDTMGKLSRHTMTKELADALSIESSAVRFHRGRDQGEIGDKIIAELRYRLLGSNGTLSKYGLVGALTDKPVSTDGIDTLIYDIVLQVVKLLINADTIAGEEQERRCSGCDHRWSGTVDGASLCGDCWRKAQPIVHAWHEAHHRDIEVSMTTTRDECYSKLCAAVDDYLSALTNTPHNDESIRLRQGRIVTLTCVLRDAPQT